MKEAIKQGASFEFYFPPVNDTIDQDEEFLLLRMNGEERKVRFHDYDEIFSVPGLYEQLFADKLQCSSPEKISSLLVNEVKKENQNPAALEILDFGAGNGMVAEALVEKGAEGNKIVGVDIIPEAREAALRDREEYYHDYHVMNCASLSDAQREKLNDYGFNAMVTVAALGFGDIPPQAFAEAFNTVENGGWVAFNIRDKFVEDEESSFHNAMKHLLEDHIDLKVKEKYVHRLNINGDGLSYYAFVGKKTDDLSLTFAE